jgi:hypothetical protein
VTELLYSTNTWLKYWTYERFYGRCHYVWCSTWFDGQKVSASSAGRLLPPSSNPADIYRVLRADVEREDRGSLKIAQQKTALLDRAAIWLANGAISREQAEEVTFRVNNSTFRDWRPLLYVIPLGPVRAKVIVVPPARRAGHTEEYIIEDLHGDEFDIVEF